MPGSDDPRSHGAQPCGQCGEPLAADQRYCLRCGTRRDPIPAAVVAQFRRPRPIAVPPPARKREKPALLDPGWLPSPRAAALAVLAMLGLGVLLGSTGQQLAQSAGLATILLEAPPPPAPEPPAEVEFAAPGESAEASVEPAPLLPAVEPAPVPEAALEAEPPPEPVLPEIPEEPGLPDVRHVFLIVLGENGFEETFGASSAAPYLAEELPELGGLVPNYYGVTQGDLANQIALLSGQGPTAETALNCPNYADLLPGTESSLYPGQVEGTGCIYPAATTTLPGQLAEAGLKWKAYLEDVGNAPGLATTCRAPLPGTPDLKRAAVPGDAYVTWREPFAYFHSLLDTGECAANAVGTDRLETDLKLPAKRAPALSYIVPNLCHDGGAAPCEPGQTLAGPVEAEAFLRGVVPQIMESPAYEDGGLIAIVSTQAQATGERADTGACCVFPAYPNLPPAAEEPPSAGIRPTGGGGRVGLLMISPFIEPGVVDEGLANHFTLLLTLEELFGLEKLGYASELALTAFGSSLFTATSEPELEPAARPR